MSGSLGPGLDSCTGCAVCFENMFSPCRGVLESMDWRKSRVHREMRVWASDSDMSYWMIHPYRNEVGKKIDIAIYCCAYCHNK